MVPLQKLTPVNLASSLSIIFARWAGCMEASKRERQGE
jgi:hypothetical protein